LNLELLNHYPRVRAGDELHAFGEHNLTLRP